MHTAYRVNATATAAVAAAAMEPAEFAQRVLDWFRSPKLDLRERFTPLFYALLYSIGDPAYDKLPPELAEPVRDIIARIRDMAARYA